MMPAASIRRIPGLATGPGTAGAPNDLIVQQHIYRPISTDTEGGPMPLDIIVTTYNGAHHSTTACARSATRATATSRCW